MGNEEWVAYTKSKNFCYRSNCKGAVSAPLRINYVSHSFCQLVLLTTCTSKKDNHEAEPHSLSYQAEPGN